MVAARGLGIVQAPPVPVWRKAPPVRQVLPAERSLWQRPSRRARSIWIKPQRESVGEKLIMALLATAGVVGIGYGFNSLINLVQHWAVFAAGVGQMIH